MADAMRHHRCGNIAVVDLFTKNTELPNEPQAFVKEPTTPAGQRP